MSDRPEILSPLFVWKAKKLHRRKPDERTQTRWNRPNTSQRCKKCFEYGHNVKTCKLRNPNEGTYTSWGEQVTKVTEAVAGEQPTQTS